MLDPVQLAQAVERVAAAATRPATVIVIGSYARSDATEASDLDSAPAHTLRRRVPLRRRGARVAYTGTSTGHRGRAADLVRRADAAALMTTTLAQPLQGQREASVRDPKAPAHSTCLSSAPIADGLRVVRIPQASSTASFASAVPWPPETMAPA